MSKEYGRKWEEANRPASVCLQREDIEKAAAVCGFHVDPAPDGTYTPWYQERAVRVTGVGGFIDLMAGVSLQYVVARREADGLVWKAVIESVLSRCLCGIGADNGDNHKVLSAIEDTLEPLAPEVRTPFPERVVTLPVPRWVHPVSDDDGYASGVEACAMFESEAKKALDKYMVALVEFTENLATESP